MIEMTVTRNTPTQGVLEKGKKYSESDIGKAFCQQLIAQGFAVDASAKKQKPTTKTEGEAE